MNITDGPDHPLEKRLGYDLFPIHKGKIFKEISAKLFETDINKPKVRFIYEIMNILQYYSGCERVCLCMKDNDHFQHADIRREKDNRSVFSFNKKGLSPDSNSDIITGMIFGRSVFSSSYQENSRTFYYLDNNRDIEVNVTEKGRSAIKKITPERTYRSALFIPVCAGDDVLGVFSLKSRKSFFFTEIEIEFYEGLVLIIGIMLFGFNTNYNLNERIKELTTLYEMSRIFERNTSPEEYLGEILKIVPLSMQFPDICFCRIVLDGKEYSNLNKRNISKSIREKIRIKGAERGEIEVLYSEGEQLTETDPFLSDEKELLKAVSRNIGMFIETVESNMEQEKLQEQLRHADRLATLGILTSGVAHELNEPLGNILGFSQLLLAEGRMNDRDRGDIEKIVESTLFAREIIKKLMFFSRQTPPKKARIDLNEIVKEGLYFLSSRCRKAGIKLKRMLQKDLPLITADPSQLHQVLVNLVVNSIQAMPEGGTLLIRTKQEEGFVALTVKDSGIGMSEEVMKKIFIPFFTTKDVNQGTGLGLSVVHGIITAHKGMIKVSSIPGKGSSFSVRLPVK